MTYTKRILYSVAINFTIHRAQIRAYEILTLKNNCPSLTVKFL